VVVFGLKLAVEQRARSRSASVTVSSAFSVGGCQVGLSRVTSIDMVYSW
jgi:hypothetical protein